MDHDRNDLEELLARYESMREAQTYGFFEEEQLEDIADYYMKNMRYTKAHEVLDLARQQHPWSPLFPVMKAHVHVLASENLLALNFLDQAQKIDPGYGDIYMARGAIYSQMGLHEKAISAFQNAGQHDIAQYEVDYHVGLELIYAGEHSQAIPLLRRCIRSNPDFEQAINELSLCYELLEDKVDSIAFFQWCVDKRPYNAAAWFCLGVSLSRAEKFQEAFNAFDYALVIRSDFSSALFNKGIALSQLGRYQEAIACYEETLNHEHPQANIYYYIGEAYEELENLDQALINYNRAIRIDDTMAEAWLGIAEVLDQQNRLHEAIHYVKKALDLEPDSTAILHVYGDFQRKLGFQEEAEVAYKRVLELEPEDPGIWSDFAQLQQEMHDYEGARETLAEGIKHHPDDAELYYHMSAFLLGIGQRQEAYGNLQRGLELDFEAHDVLFEFMPQLRDNSGLLAFIESHRK